ncbi:MAG: antitoxin MazE family protein [Novosphingobium sp.]
MAKRRAALRAQGLRPKQSWVPDVRDPRVIEGIRRSVAIIRADAEENEVMAMLESLHDEVMANEPDYDWGPQGPPGDDPSDR